MCGLKVCPGDTRLCPVHCLRILSLPRIPKVPYTVWGCGIPTSLKIIMLSAESCVLHNIALPSYHWNQMYTAKWSYVCTSLHVYIFAYVHLCMCTSLHVYIFACVHLCMCTVAALNIEPKCNIHCLFSLSLRFWRVQSMGGMNWKRPTAIKGTMHHAKPSFSKEIFASAIISVVQYLTPLRYIFATSLHVYIVVKLLITPLSP
jgi:hypothetical protein